jgi:hypothetical protein
LRIAIAKDDKTLFIPNGLQKIVRFELETGKIVDTIELPTAPSLRVISQPR